MHFSQIEAIVLFFISVNEFEKVLCLSHFLVKGFILPSILINPSSRN